MALESLHVHEASASARYGAAMETMTAETGQMRPTAQVADHLMLFKYTIL